MKEPMPTKELPRGYELVSDGVRRVVLVRHENLDNIFPVFPTEKAAIQHARWQEGLDGCN